MNNTKISVVTPSLNQVRFIEETILSVINQNYPNLEYIIADGGSTDGTIEIIRKYESKLAFWSSEKDNGQTDAINKGLKKATGEIVCWINSDDILLPNALQNVADFFKENPKTEFLNGFTLKIDKESNILFTNHILKQNAWFAKFGVFNIAQQSMFWRKRLMDRIGYLDESFHAEMDKEFLIRIFESKAKIGAINKNLGAIRIHDETKTSIGGNIWIRDKEEIRKRYHGKYDDSNRNLMVFALFVLVKLCKFKYLQNYLFKKRWSGKPVSTYFP
jgi:glycosyltransferase involved in cell wall biosynthesis